MQGAMQDNFERLSYRDLADRLGISPDAARMKAKRKVKAGLWRIIPGNHPSERVLIEMPAADLNGSPERVGGEQRQRATGERTPRTVEAEQGNALAEQFLASLTEAQERIRQLTDQLLAGNEAHRRDAMELAAAEMREIGTKAELERALADVAVLKDQLRLLMERQRKPWWRKIFGASE